ncbi:MAG: hypothetical protein GY719_30535, partial [bacterium]|nr:hypothetical protein [bacterium]
MDGLGSGGAECEPAGGWRRRRCGRGSAKTRTTSSASWYCRGHPFFFEHPLDHYPGLMLIEAGRQFGTTVAHLLYGVPFDTAFILNGLRVDFTSFAELGKPV